MMIAFIIALEETFFRPDFYYHSWRNNVVIVFGKLSSFLTQLHIVSGIVCVGCPFAGDEKLKNIHVHLALLV